MIQEIFLGKLNPTWDPDDEGKQDGYEYYDRKFPPETTNLSTVSALKVQGGGAEKKAQAEKEKAFHCPHGKQDGNEYYDRKFPAETTNNLSTVSALYIYMDTPPHGYGN